MLTFFAVNRHGQEAIDIHLSAEQFGPIKSVDHILIKHDDLEARNTAASPETVAPRRMQDTTRVEGTGVHVTVPPYSYSMIRIKL